MKEKYDFTYGELVVITGELDTFRVTYWDGFDSYRVQAITSGEERTVSATAIKSLFAAQAVKEGK